MGTMQKSLLYLALLLPGLAHAGRPLSTEDASTLDDYRSIDDADWGIGLVAGLARALLHLNS